MAEPIEIPFGFRTPMGAGNHILDGGPDTPTEGKEQPIVSIGTFYREQCKNGWIDRFAVWIVDSGAKGSTSSIVFARWCQWEGVLAPPGGYNWTARLRRLCSRMSNYFDHLLILHAAVKCASCAVHRDNKTYTHAYVKVANYCATQLTTTIAILIRKLVFSLNLITVMHKNPEPQYIDMQHTTTDQVRMVLETWPALFV